MLKKDLHIHATAYNAFPTIDHTVANVIEKCHEAELDYAGILEHLNPTEKHPIHFIEQLIAEFKELELPENYFVGVEADLNADGSDSCGIDNRENLQLDYVIASVHLGPTRIDKLEDYIDEEFKRISLALENNKVIDIIGHPWVQGVRWERNGSIPSWEFSMVPNEYQDHIIELATIHNKAIEVNNLQYIIENDQGYRSFLNKLLESDVKVSIGSDAHQMDNIKNSVSRTNILEKMGFKDERIWIPKKKTIK